MAKKTKILCLIPAPGDISIFKDLENQFDWYIETGNSIDNFVAALNEVTPDVILFIAGQSSFSAKVAIQQLSDSGKRIPFIVLLENPSVEYAVELIKSGADDVVLLKNLDRLPSTIQEVLDRFHSENGVGESTAQNELKFRRLIENGTDPVIVFSPTGATSYISPAAEEVLGYSPTDLAQMDITQILHHEEVTAANRYLSSCIENPGVSIGSITARVKHKNGEWRWMEATLTNLLHDPEVRGIVNNFKDITEKKQAERGIKESQEKYKLFFENNLDGVLLTSDEGDILAANPEACRIFRMTERELLEAGRSGITDASDPRLTMGIKERQETGKSRFETTMIRKGGEKFPAELTSAVFRDVEGNSRNSIIVRDLAELKRTEEELKVSQENYKMLFQFSPIPNWVYEEGTLDIMDVNQAAIDHYGYSREEFLQLNLRDLRPANEIPKLLKDLKDIEGGAGGHNVQVGRFFHQKKNGEKITVDIYGYPIKFQQRDCRLIVCIDVTEQEAVVKKLQEKSAKLLSAERLAKLGYWEVGLQQPYFFWSDEVYRIWGRKKQTFQVGIDVFEKTVHPDDLEEFREGQEQAIKGKGTLDYEHRIILPDGSIKWVHEKGKLVKDSEGNPLRFEGSVQDITERKIALQKLTISEARHRAILKSQTNYLTRVDLEGNYSYANDKFKKDFNWIFPEGGLIGKPASSSVMEYHHQRVKSIFKKCVTNPNNVYQVQIDKLKEKGGVTSTLWDFVCLTDINGRPVEVQGVGIDITDRIKAEQSLKESNARYELVSKATSDAMWDWDLKSGYLVWGEGLKTLFGYSPNEVEPNMKIWNRNVHPQDFHEVEESLDKAIAGTTNHWEAEYRFRKSNGEYTFVFEKGFIIRDENGEAIRMVGAMQDINKIKQAEVDLLSAYKEKETILESIGDAFFTLNGRMEVTYWNNKAEELLDFSKEEAVGEDIRDLFPEEVDSSFEKYGRKAIIENETQHFEEYLERTNSWYEVNLYPAGTGLSLYLRDITERKKSEFEILELNKNLKIHTEELVTANKGLEQFSFIVSHNLRSPVANILGLADLLGQDDYPADVKENFMQELLNNVKRLDDVVTDLNDILQVKVDLDAKRETIILEDLVHSIKSSIGNLVEKSRAEIVTDFEISELHTVQSYLYSIFYNLIANSIKYRQPAVTPVITIKSELKDGNIYLTFEDNGLGFDMPKKSQQVFGLYKRFHDHVEGKGMGLFLVKTQVELLGGKISVESEVNGGTRFTIVLKEETSNLLSENEEKTSLYSR